MGTHKNDKNIMALSWLFIFIPCSWDALGGLPLGIIEGVLGVIVVHREYYIKGQQSLACVSGGLHGSQPTW